MKTPITARAHAPLPPFRVLSVASEVFPLVKTGGLADVTGALPHALRAQGIEVQTLVPGYPAVLAALASADAVWADPDYFGGPARLLAGDCANLPLFALDAPHLYDRPGNPYTGPDGHDWPDNPQRFAALAYAAALIGRGAVPGFLPSVVHAHDWQAGLAPAYLALAGGVRPATVMTVHNLAFQGQVPAALLATLRLPEAAYTPDGFEYYGAIGMLKAGLRYADRLTTVSPTYAAEICTPEGGMSLDGLLRSRADRLTGIVNGIDTALWNPETDPLLPARFCVADLVGKAVCKAALQDRFSLDAEPSTLLFGVVSRLTHQKGLDILLLSLAALLAQGAQLAVLGAGDAGLQSGLVRATQANPGRVAVRIGYDEALAHLMQAGSDAVLVPSRFEPCGLTQLCALRYGAVPVVSRVGGLADTVIDANEAARSAGAATGVQFAPATAPALTGAIQRTAALWRLPEEWSVMRARAMHAEVGWTRSAQRYAALYREAAAASR